MRGRLLTTEDSTVVIRLRSGGRGRRPSRSALVAALLLAAWGTAVVRAAETMAVFIRLVEEAETSAEQAGVLKRLHVKEGQMVREGDVVAEINDAEARLQLKQADVELRVAREQAQNDVKIRAAKKAAEVAKNDHQRYLRAVESRSDAYSESEVEHAKLTAEKAVLDVESAERELLIAKLNAELKASQRERFEELLKKHRILAPFDAVVVEVHGHRGEWVQAGDKVVRLLRLDRLRAEGFVPVDRIRPDWVGRAVAVRVPSAGDQAEPFRGTIVFVSPEVAPSDKKVAVWAEVMNPAGLLRPGMEGTLTIADK